MLRLTSASAPGPCKVSHDGRYIASLSASAVSVRATSSLRLVKVVKLPADFHGPICAFAWAPSSTKVLVATADRIHVFAVIGSSFSATIRNPACAQGKPPLLFFGTNDNELLTSSVFGLKLSVLDLGTSKVVEIANPKFHDASSATRSFAIRPATGHLCVLTRFGGKDLLSIHHPATRLVETSWSPASIDGQGIMWTPDGKWLLLWESPAQGHGLFLYTPDGQHFRTIGAESLSHGQPFDAERALEPGFKSCQLSPDGELCALGDHGRAVSVLSTRTWRETMRLLHPATIVPRDTAQVSLGQRRCFLASCLGPSHELTRPAQGMARAGRLDGPMARRVVVCAHDANHLASCIYGAGNKAGRSPEPGLLAGRIRLFLDASGNQARRVAKYRVDLGHRGRRASSRAALPLERRLRLASRRPRALVADVPGRPAARHVVCLGSAVQRAAAGKPRQRRAECADSQDGGGGQAAPGGLGQPRNRAPGAACG